MGIVCLSKSKREKEKENMEKIIKIAINGDPYIIKTLQRENFGIDFTKYITNIGNLIKNPTQEIDAIQFYDVIVSIQSIKDIINGWNIRFSQRFLKDQKNFINQKILKIGVIGNSNKGKSFILSKLSQIKLPSGTSIKTEGLSIKYPDLEIYKNRRIALLDSAGLESPVIRENDNSEIGNENIEENQNIDNNGKDIISNENKKGNQEKNISELFKEKSRDKILTELFLQNYIIHNSDILIIVVGILTYSEQKLLNRIKIELKRAKLNKTLYIIHNLMTYTTIYQVKSYINEILLKSGTFELEQQLTINFNTIDKNESETEVFNTAIEDESGECFFEKNNISFN